MLLKEVRVFKVSIVFINLSEKAVFQITGIVNKR
jgi:hypothetical protein